MIGNRDDGYRRRLIPRQPNRVPEPPHLKPSTPWLFWLLLALAAGVAVVSLMGGWF